MSDNNFNVDPDLFCKKNTGGKYLVSVKTNDDKTMDISYLNIDDNENIQIETETIYDNFWARKIIKEEKIDTFLRILELNKWQEANHIYYLRGQLYDLLIDKNIKLLISTLFLGSGIILGKSINQFINEDPNYIYNLILGATIAYFGITNNLKYQTLNDKYKQLKKEINELIINKGNSLIRKK